MIKFKLTNNTSNGITLIALVITIIVLLILAGISISMLTGQNGILNRAQEAKEKTQLAGIKEKLQMEIMSSYGIDGNIDITQLNENLKNIGIENVKITSLPAKIEIEGHTFVVNGSGSINNLITMSEAQSDNMLKNTENYAVEDDYGNIIIIPAGFKITKNTTKVPEGIVIEDSDIVTYEDGTKSTGNQFVWVPVGKIYTTSDEATKESTSRTIKLSRYEFADGINDYIDKDGNIITSPSLGKPIEKENKMISGSNSSYFFIEDITNGTNGHSIDIEQFKTNTKMNGGYYIARFEASYGVDEKPNSKVSLNYSDNTPPISEGTLWNYITQPYAAMVSREMYTSDKFTSDLVNSYAWDTAIVFIQEFSEDSVYSKQTGINICNIFSNTGVNGDKKLNIYDMAGNLYEWTTETYNYENTPCTRRGGWYNGSVDNTSIRNNFSTSDKWYYCTFRTIIYIN